MTEARTELTRKGSLMMVNMMKSKYPQCHIEYDEESERYSYIYHIWLIYDFFFLGYLLSLAGLSLA